VSATRLTGIRAVTLDFGNTLVPVERATLRAVVEVTAARASDALGLGGAQEFLATWVQERDRQFREDVPLFREVDLAQRAIRVLARLRGLAMRADEAWDDAAATAWSTEDEVALVVSTYSDAFVATVHPPPGSGQLIETLSGRGFQVAILSNWPLASTIDRVAEAAGWAAHLSGIFVSERIGTIKPHRAIFAHVEAALDRRPTEILHVGDDWAADVVGAAAAGWRVAYVRDRQHDTSLPTSERGEGIEPDLELDELAELPAHLADPPLVHSRHGGT
jgi:HAD superfamily hydrolase (TIGR01509 family)